MIRRRDRSDVLNSSLAFSSISNTAALLLSNIEFSELLICHEI